MEIVATTLSFYLYKTLASTRLFGATFEYLKGTELIDCQRPSINLVKHIN